MLCIGKCSLWPEKFTCSLCVYLWIRLAFFLHWKNHSLHIIHYTSKFACRHFHWNFHHQPNCIRLERDCRWTKTVYSNKLNVCTFIYLFASVVGWRVLFVLENCKIDREVNVCLVFLAPNGTSFMWITTEIIQIFFCHFFDADIFFPRTNVLATFVFLLNEISDRVCNGVSINQSNSIWRQQTRNLDNIFMGWK